MSDFATRLATPSVIGIAFSSPTAMAAASEKSPTKTER